MSEAQERTYHPSIDAVNSRLNGDESTPAVLAILAAGRDIAHQLGRIADDLTIERIVHDADASFGRYPAGHPANDPNVATRDEASVALAAARPV